MSIIEKALNKSVAQRLPVSKLTGGTLDAEADEDFEPAYERHPSFNDTLPLVKLDFAKMESQGLLPSEDHAMRLREEYRRIKWPLLDVALNRTSHELENSNLIMVTSSIPGEGKTFCTINLALSMARQKQCTVLLVDADTAKPKISRLLGLDEKPGLSELLEDPGTVLTDVMHRTSVDRLFIVPAGVATQDSPELMAGGRMRALVRELAQLPRGHIVIFDTAPLLANNEAQVMSRLVGQVAFVIRADTTPRVAVREAISLVNKKAALGVILNKTTTGVGAKYYGDYYSYGRD